MLNKYEDKVDRCTVCRRISDTLVLFENIHIKYSNNEYLVCHPCFKDLVEKQSQREAFDGESQ